LIICLLSLVISH